MKRDVVIIGGGAIGLCAAWYLQRQGRHVTIVDKGRLGAACSHGNAGLVAPSHVVPLAAPGVVAQGLKWMFNPSGPFYIKPRPSLSLFIWLRKFLAACTEDRMMRAVPLLHQLTQAGRDLYGELAEELEFQLEARGLLMAFSSEKGRRDCRHEAELAQTCGLKTELLDYKALRALEPVMPEHISGAVYYPGDAHITPHHFMQAMAAKLRQLANVDVLEQTEVKDFETSAGRISGVVTGGETLRADQIVLTGGAWSADLARRLKLRLPLQPAKGYSITLEPPGPKPRIPMILTEAKVAVTPMEDKLRFAGTLELAGLNDQVNMRRVHAILKHVPTFYGSFDPKSVKPSDVWFGFRPCTPDGLPYLGKTGAYENLTIAAGHAMLGITLAPISGQLVAQIIGGEKPSVDLGALSPDRNGV